VLKPVKGSALCPQGHSADDPELTAPAGVTAEAEAEVVA